MKRVIKLLAQLGVVWVIVVLDIARHDYAWAIGLTVANAALSALIMFDLWLDAEAARVGLAVERAKRFGLASRG